MCNEQELKTAEMLAEMAISLTIEEIEKCIVKCMSGSSNKNKWIDTFWHEMAISEALIMSKRIYERNT